jgi:hypothetical protein
VGIQAAVKAAGRVGRPATVGAAEGCDLLILLFLRKKIAACGSSYRDSGATKRVGIQAAVEAAGRVGRPASISCARIGLAMRRIFR